MRISRIYSPRALAGDSLIALEPEPSHYLSRVLRLGVGDPLVLFDGNGGQYPAQIIDVSKKKVQVKTGAREALENESTLRIHLGIALSRGERMDWVVQKATELGVDALTPLITERTGVKLTAERAEKRLKHLQQIAISACEQCGRNTLPIIHPLTQISMWLSSTTAQRKFVLHHRAQPIGVETQAPTSVALLIGPEGGLSDEEIAAAEQADFSSLRLGPRVLRTETAPLAAIAVLQSYWGDMNPG